MLQVKIKFRLIFFNLGRFPISFASCPKLFMNNQGYETKEIENQPRLKNFNLNLILTCNIYVPPMGDPKQLDTPTAQAAANISVFLDSFYKFHDHAK